MTGDRLTDTQKPDEDPKTGEYSGAFEITRRDFVNGTLVGDDVAFSNSRMDQIEVPSTAYLGNPILFGKGSDLLSPRLIDILDVGFQTGRTVLIEKAAWKLSTELTMLHQFFFQFIPWENKRREVWPKRRFQA